MNTENTDHRPGRQKLEIAKELHSVDSTLTFLDSLSCYRGQQPSQVNQDRNPIQLFWVIIGNSFPMLKWCYQGCGLRHHHPETEQPRREIRWLLVM